MGFICVSPVSNRRAIGQRQRPTTASRSPPNPNPVGEYSNWSSPVRYRSPPFPNPPIPQSKI
ncbi:hypothetical protein [Microcoleus sp.]|uniref:hypothetical protein n=1 Tax=Microcoleus sp. TaxID=44472 RepID=UPI003593461D